MERAVKEVGNLAPEAQDEIAQVVLAPAGVEEAIVTLTGEAKDSLQKSLAQAQRREFVTDETIDAIWAKHGL